MKRGLLNLENGRGSLDPLPELREYAPEPVADDRERELEQRLLDEARYEESDFSCWQDRDADDAGVNPYGAL